MRRNVSSEALENGAIVGKVRYASDFDKNTGQDYIARKIPIILFDLPKISDEYSFHEKTTTWC